MNDSRGTILIPCSYRTRLIVSSIFDKDCKLSALKVTDFAYFVATWWPKAEYEQLKVLLYFMIWLFTWDDEIEEPTGC